MITLERFRDDEGFPLTSCVVQHLAKADEVQAVKDETKELDRRVLDALRSNGPQHKKPLARIVKARDAAVSAALARLEVAGKVSQDKSNRWSVVEGGWSAKTKAQMKAAAKAAKGKAKAA